MKSEQELSQNPAEDRAALREELLRSADCDRLTVFDALNRDADEADENIPKMPDSLRDQLIEQFGDRTPMRAAVAPPAPGFISSVIELFKAKPLAGYGGLAAAACAVMFIFMQTGGVDNGERRDKIDTLRGGDDKGSALTAGIPIYLFPESESASVVSKMTADREVIVCVDRGDFEKRLGGQWAIAVDLGERVVSTFEKTNPVDVFTMDGEGDLPVLMGIRQALDAVESRLME